MARGFMPIEANVERSGERGPGLSSTARGDSPSIVVDEWADAFALAAEHGPPLLIVSADDGDARAAHGDPPLHVHWANPAAQQLLGLDTGARTMPTTATIGPATNWSRAIARAVVTSAADNDNDNDNEDADADAGEIVEWHPASLDVPAAPTGQVLFRTQRLAAAAGRPRRSMVWLRPADSALVRAENAAADADFRFRTLGENAPIGILMSEVGLRLAFANDGFAQIADVPCASLLGTGWLDVFAADDMTAVIDLAQGVLSGEPANMTVRIRHASGAPRWARLKLTPVITRNRAAGFVGTVEDVTSRLSRESELSYQASHDPLTGLANRRQLMGTLTGLFDRRRREDRQFAVLFCDLDGFKEINDKHGHDAGDRLLIEVARRMSAVAREDDVVGRLAGDEFVVVLRHIATLDEARSAATRQLATLSREIHLGAAVVEVSASIGIAMAADHRNADGILRAADVSMYAAKRAGGAQTHAVDRKASVVR